MTVPDAEHFDQWYADMARSPRRDMLFNRNLGLPPEFESTSLLTFDGITEIRDRLGLAPEATVLDLACGRGGYGLWLGRETGARVVGVDFSSVAVEQARSRARELGQGDTSEFVVGSFSDIGLPDASVDAVICIDAIQFADDIEDAAARIRRVLRPGGVVALTCWQARDRADDTLPDRMRRLDLARQLGAGGLVDVTVEDRPSWLDAERRMWEEAMALDPGDDPALASLKEEGSRVLPTLDRMRRVLAIGRAPD